MKQHFSYIEELFDAQQYVLMTKNIQDFHKVTSYFKKYSSFKSLRFFDDILNKQLDLCGTNIKNAQKITKYMQQPQLPLSKSLLKLSQIVQDLFTFVKQGNLEQQDGLNQYESLVREQIDKIIEHHNGYVQTAIKYYKNDEQQYKKSLDGLKNRKQQYTEQLELYKQTVNDPSMLYNQNLKQQRYNELQQKIRKIKENENQILTSLEVLNYRRKCLCIELQQLQKIIEEAYSTIIALTHKLCYSNIISFKKKLESFYQMSKKHQKQIKYQFTILPDQSKFNFDKIDYVSQQDFQQLYYVQKNFNFNQDESFETLTQNNEDVSFRSIKNIPSVNQSYQTINDQNDQWIPNFLKQDIQLVPTSQLIQYYEWILTYTKVVKENCSINNNLIFKLLQFIDELMIQFRKQGKACIKQPDFKQNYFSQLKWFEQFNQVFGEQGYNDLYAYTSINDLFNLFTNKFSNLLQEEQQSILQVQEKITNEQNIVFSSIDKQMFDLQIVHQNYLRQQGYNRTITLSQMDSNKKDFYNQPKNEQDFRQMIKQSNDAIKHLVLELDNKLSKRYKTISEITEQINLAFNINLIDLLKFTYQQEDALELKKKSLEQVVQYLKTQNSFSIFYKQIFVKNKAKTLIEDLQTETYDYKYQSDQDFYQLSTLPKPNIILDQSQNDQEDDQQSISEQSTKEQDKDKIEQLQFIKSKLKIEINEILIASFACALSEKIQLQGRLYITNKRLFFHSSFNSNNLFFGDTILNIPKQDIMCIQKRANAYIFDNSISIFTPKGQLFFATFFQRDIAYDLIIKTFSPKEQPELMASLTNQAPINSIKIINVPYTQDQLKLLEERQQRILNLMGPDPEIFIAESIFEFPEINVKLFYRLIFGDKMLGQNMSFYEKMKKGPLGCDGLNLTQWIPAPPMDFDSDYGTQNLLDGPDFLEREFSCIQPLPKSSIPFMPTKCDCKEQQKIYFINQDFFILDLIVKTYKVPYAESFQVLVRYKCTQTEKGVKLDCRVRNEFLKAILVKKVIEKASQDEISEKTNQKIFPAIRQELSNYLKGSNSNDNGEDKSDTNEQKVEQQKSKIKQKLKSMIPFVNGTIITCLILIVIYFLYVRVLSKLTIKIEFDK
ncbi:unnamed protein product (macronuclear) [Paramecium tetraurelia]|uniref:VASt domain-containing protein n=1 Tax=Paramecium tetraurelia TaxID=5888 RepID=A0BFR5_PARTE|nr:uncharacterized protein GSPATT00028417001 [Paramecium tetraurelia]CAK57382.1 unnamed protein product [Paramecium tetraurelia]|eukprot:XP_001424780.1 hypothetical protein (macronuclear) [Paramecium tetraurelia strain d4-2]